MAYLSSLLTPWRSYGALRDQLGSVRKVYLAADKVTRHDDMGERPLVLLLHGFFQTRNIWDVLEDRLRHDGYSVISFNLGGLLWRFNTHPVDRSAKLVASKIETLAVRHDFDKLHIVGHSKGGLIARRYVQNYGGDRRVRSVLTLGTPHHGTPTAAAGVALMGFGALPTSATELMPGSRLVNQLGRDSFPAHVPLTSVYSREDLVCPHWCSVLRPRPGEHTHMTNREVRGVGHSQLAWDGEVYRIIRERLDDAERVWAERTAPADPTG